MSGSNQTGTVSDRTRCGFPLTLYMCDLILLTSSERSCKRTDASLGLRPDDRSDPRLP